MTDSEHLELSKALHAAAGMVVVSGYDCDLYRDLYRGWMMLTHEAHASGNNGGVMRTECLWLSPSAVARMGRQTLMDATA